MFTVLLVPNPKSVIIQWHTSKPEVYVENKFRWTVETLLCLEPPLHGGEPRGAGGAKTSLKEMSSSFLELVEECSAANSQESFQFNEVSKARTHARNKFLGIFWHIVMHVHIYNKVFSVIYRHQVVSFVKFPTKMNKSFSF